MRIKIKYGLDSLDREVSNDATVGDIRRNSSYQAALGYGDNVNFVRNGEVLEDDETLSSGDTLSIENRANEKQG